MVFVISVVFVAPGSTGIDSFVSLKGLFSKFDLVVSLVLVVSSLKNEQIGSIEFTHILPIDPFILLEPYPCHCAFIACMSYLSVYCMTEERLDGQQVYPPEGVPPLGQAEQYLYLFIVSF